MKPVTQAAIHMGEVIPIKNLFLGKSWIGKVVSVLNAVLKMKVILADRKQAKIVISGEGGLIVDLTKVESIGDGAWHFAAIRKYNPATVYGLDESVIVGYDQSNIATPGQFILVQTPSLNHAPIWPPPGMTEDEAINNPDNVLIFWWPINKYC